MTSLPVLTPATLPLTTSVCVEAGYDDCGHSAWSVYCPDMLLQQFADLRMDEVESHDDYEDWRITDLQSGVVYSYRG